jgi:PAS domain S-box-containing protein
MGKSSPPTATLEAVETPLLLGYLAGMASLILVGIYTYLTDSRFAWVVALGLALGLFVSMFWRIRRETRARSEADSSRRASDEHNLRARNELMEANAFLDSLIENLPLMVLVKDAVSRRVVRMNREAERVVGFTREETLGKTPGEMLEPSEAALRRAGDDEALRTRRPVEMSEDVMGSRMPGIRTYHSWRLPILDQAGNPRMLLTIAVDITQEKIAAQAILDLNAALEAKAAQLAESNQELESFSYSVSHDLRAPLRAIDGFGLMLEEDYKDRIDAEGQRYIAIIRDNSKRMGLLIDDLLKFSQLGRTAVASQAIDMEELVGEVIGELLLRRDRIDIDVGTLPPAYGDFGLVRQVWVNLISNAIKYSGKMPSPKIEIRGLMRGADSEYNVRDNGVGFDMAYGAKLFGVFQRLHSATEFSGTGVGLAIVHRIVTRHGGRVWAEGKVDAGATFTFTLPGSPDQRRSQEAVTRLHEMTSVLRARAFNRGRTAPLPEGDSGV